MLVTQKSQNSLPNIDSTNVELCFSVVGKVIPADHGYGLYSALTHCIKELHELPGWSLGTISGIPDQQGKIYLGDRSKLRIRLPYEQVPLVYPLAGKKITIGVHNIILGIPQIFTLSSASQLRSRLVVIKGYQEPESFLAAAQRQLEKLGIKGNTYISTNSNGEIARKTIKIKKFTVVGFGLEIKNLDSEDSLLLQKVGIGGKRRMGCGVFVPQKS
ncbi:MAG: type I-MYXAN CRISPR-associated protein Cas6/Cmx6 [Cyanobacteria bacterium J06621_8]